LRFEIEEQPVWDEEKRRLLLETYNYSFPVEKMELGAPLPQIWGCLIDDDDSVLGFMYITSWKENEGGDGGEAEDEISLVVDSSVQTRGFGSVLLEKAEEYLRSKDILLATVRVQPSNPRAYELIDWFYRKDYICYWPGFNGNEPKNLEFAKKTVGRQDVTLKKNLSQ